MFPSSIALVFFCHHLFVNGQSSLENFCRGTKGCVYPKHFEESTGEGSVVLVNQSYACYNSELVVQNDYLNFKIPSINSDETYEQVTLGNDEKCYQINQTAGDEESGKEFFLATHCAELLMNIKCSVESPIVRLINQNASEFCIKDGLTALNQIYGLEAPLNAFKKCS